MTLSWLVFYIIAQIIGVIWIIATWKNDCKEHNDNIYALKQMILIYEFAYMIPLAICLTMIAKSEE